MLGEEAARVDVLFGGEPVDRAQQLHFTVWLDDEGDRGARHLVGQACGHSFNHTSDAAERLQILVPTVVQRSHRNDGFLGQEPCQDVDDLLDESFSYLYRLLPQVGERFHLVDIQVGVASPVELVVDFEQPRVHI